MFQLRGYQYFYFYQIKWSILESKIQMNGKNYCRRPYPFCNKDIFSLESLTIF
jgi:hypothetical protein